MIYQQWLKFSKITKGCSIIKKGQVIFKNNQAYKAPLVGSRSNRFWKDLKKFRE